MLAESEASSLWRLPAAATLEWLQCEADQPVDDLMIGTSEGGGVFSQVKHTVDLSTSPSSDLAATLDQFVHQVGVCRSASAGAQPRERPLAADRDRLVLIVGPTTSAAVRLDLPAVLERLRGLPGTRSLGRAAVNERETRVLAVVLSHVRRSWEATFGRRPSDAELREFLLLLHVQPLDVGPGGGHEREAKQLLSASVVRDPAEVDSAWALLLRACAGFAATRSGADRRQLQHILLDARIEIQAVRSYREDIERLRNHSGLVLASMARLARIQVGGAVVKIVRRSTDDIRRAAEEGSLVVVGEPGAGKSGALHDLVEALRQRGADVVLLAVDRLAARSLGELRQELGLSRDVRDVLANWPGTEGAFLVVDALDAARDDRAADAVRELIRTVADAGGRWRAVASIREFDLRYSPELHEIFGGEPPTEFRDEEFGKIRHVNVPRLSDEELDLFAAQSAALATVIREAPSELREILRIPFNLRLAADLLGAGVPAADLRPIRTQLELLDRYWTWRVTGPRGGGGGDAREAVLRRACEAMVAARTLRADRQELADPAAEAPLREVLSNEVLVEWQAAPGVGVEPEFVAFGHHVVFDYAVARLLLRGDPGALVRRLEADTELPLVVRPSLVLHFHHLWLQRDRERFWDLVFRVVRSDRVPEIGKLIGPSVAAALAQGLSELEPLCRALEDGEVDVRRSAESALRHLVGTLLAQS